MSASHFCENCGAEYSKWQGKCDVCESWSTIVEQNFTKKDAKKKRKSGGLTKQNGHKNTDLQAKSLSEIDVPKVLHVTTNIPEFDRVLGGGLIPGAVVLISGEPGIGKSTLLLQLALELGQKKGECLYISGEESLAQLKGRSSRLITGKEDIDKDSSLKFSSAHILEDIEQQLISLASKKSRDDQISVAIVDSVQMLESDEVAGVPGGVAQVKYCAGELTWLAKSLGITLIFVGHINKSGNLAGPKVLEHLVDTVLLFEHNQESNLRILRSRKNRFGSVDEIGLFLMNESGLNSVSNPGEYFSVDAGDTKKTGVAKSVIYEGKRPLIVDVQALVVDADAAYPKRVAVGLDNSKLQLLIAVITKYLQVNLGDSDVYINVARGLKTKDNGIDLAVCAAIYSSYQQKPLPKDRVYMGEVTLAGDIILPGFAKRRVKEAQNLGYQVGNFKSVVDLKK